MSIDWEMEALLTGNPEKQVADFEARIRADERAQVRQHIRGVFPDVVAAIEAVEREACALIVEDTDVETHSGYYHEDNGAATLRNAAAAIRARKP